MSETGDAAQSDPPLAVLAPANDPAVLTYARIVERSGEFPRWIVWMAVAWACLAVINGVFHWDWLRKNFAWLVYLYGGSVPSRNGLALLPALFTLAGEIGAILIPVLAIYMRRERRILWLLYAWTPIALVIVLGPIAEVGLYLMHRFTLRTMFVGQLMLAVAQGLLPAMLIVVLLRPIDRGPRAAIRVVRLGLIVWSLAGITLVLRTWNIDDFIQTSTEAVLATIALVLAGLSLVAACQPSRPLLVAGVVCMPLYFVTFCAFVSMTYWFNTPKFIYTFALASGVLLVPFALLRLMRTGPRADDETSH